MPFINCTPHAINVIKDDTTITFEPCGLVIRLSEINSIVDNIDGINITRTHYGDVRGLPDQVDGTYLIVSALVKNAVKYRNDLVVPTNMVRDDNGRIIGCKSLGI